MTLSGRRKRTRFQRGSQDNGVEPGALVVRGPAAQRWGIATTGRTTLGSGEGCQIVLDDPYVSQLHASLCWEDGRLWIEDEASRNGTWVNNLQVQRCSVATGTRIDLGSSRLLVETAAAPVAHTHGIVGQSELMQRVFRDIERFAVAPFPVLVLGETGTGKELVARALHEASKRAGGPFEAVNCAAIPRELAESELFGHLRGAFTGATREFAGAFSRADGGTLFLDEVGEMPLELQPKLLRVLEERAVRPVGGSQATPIDIRLVAATHRDLQELVARGRFREDLYYRLCVGTVELPPLRQRQEDILSLVEHFLEQEGAGGLERLAPEVSQLLITHEWPGNVRALKHALWRALALSDGRRLEVTDFSGVLEPRPAGGSLPLEAEGSFAELTSAVYQRALERHGGNCAAAARSLGIPKSTFYGQLRAMQLSARPASPGH